MHTDSVIEFLQSEVEAGYKSVETLQLLHLIGKILCSYKNFVTYRMKGIVLDRIFNALRDSQITKVPSTTLSEILSSVRSQNLGWRFFIDSVNKLHFNGESDDLFFVKSFSIVKGHFRTMQILDVTLLKLLVNDLLVPHFGNLSTVVRKQVVLTLSEAWYAVDVRLQSQSQLFDVDFASMLKFKLNQG